ncbi:MAG: energy-coupling factor ABC transporter permease [Treponema sp.]|jgi:cobalt/nickel transport system permease protein|nr:energy-coupling factor ABC transporter permease [Treponema sp.]
MGAFVFAAQMINFTIPLTGSSGHIGGGVLLAAMLGAFPALLAVSAVLIIQCLFFADGGLFALGCNIFNLGVIPCLLVYPFIYKPFVKNSLTNGRITLAAIITVVVSLQIGAFGVVMQTLLSGITELPFGTFLVLMQPIHFAIGIIEGVVTAAVLCFIYKMRPEIIESTFERKQIQSGVPIRNIIISLAVITVIAGGLLSLFVSSHPDGLEWSIEKTSGSPELETGYSFVEGAGEIQEKTAFLPDYNFRDSSEEGIYNEVSSTLLGTTVSGIAGAAITFIITGIAVFAIYLFKRKQKGKPVTA